MTESPVRTRNFGSPPKPTSSHTNNTNTHSRPPRTTPKKRPDKLPPSSTNDAGRRQVIESQRQQQQQQHIFKNNTKVSALETISTPGSVLLVNPLGSVSLTRDLSDLSGSYLNGSTTNGPRSVTKVPGNVFQSDHSTSSFQRPWRHAKVLSSSRLPQHPQPPTDDDVSVGAAINRTKTNSVPNNVDLSAMEVIQNALGTVANTAMSTFNADALADHQRIPLLVLLMDPGRKVYELMQMWIDVESDQVRNIVHTMQNNLGDHWKQDYDGAFQVRNNHFSQLAHVLTAAKYDVQPYELWVAKPWSMPAKATVSYASGLLNHLKAIGVLSYIKASEQSKWKNIVFRTNNHQPTNSNDDTILSLSKQAQQRVYIPGGVLKHHHACQFLSFSPPFEATGTVRVDVLAGDSCNDTDCESLHSQLSDSHCGYSLACDSDDNIEFGKINEIESVVPSIAAGSGSTPLPPLTNRSLEVIDSAEFQSEQPHLSNLNVTTTKLETESIVSQSPVIDSHQNISFAASDSLGMGLTSDFNKEVTLHQYQQHRVNIKQTSKSRWKLLICCRKNETGFEDGQSDNEDHYTPPNMKSLRMIEFDSPSSATVLDSTSSHNTNNNNNNGYSGSGDGNGSGTRNQQFFHRWDIEDTAFSTDGHSIVSESAPLLFGKL